MGLEDMDGFGGGRCKATYGDVKCWRERGHRLQHHGPGDTWWEEGEVPTVVESGPPRPSYMGEAEGGTKPMQSRCEATYGELLCLLDAGHESEDHLSHGPVWWVATETGVLKRFDGPSEIYERIEDKVGQDDRAARVERETMQHERCSKPGTLSTITAPETPPSYMQSRVEIKQSFENAYPDRIAREMMEQMERALSRRDLPSAPAFLNTEIGVLRASLQDCVVAAVEEVKPCGIRLVGVVLQGRPAPRWWRWAEPVALWLLKRAGFEVCR